MTSLEYALQLVAWFLLLVLLVLVLTGRWRRRRRQRRDAAAAPPGLAAARPASWLVLDTSAVIDGRALDWLEVALDPRPAVAPACVRQEVAHLAGSSEEGRQRRGALGVENLGRLDTRATAIGTGATDIPGVEAAIFQMHQPGGTDAALLELLVAAPGAILVTLDAELASRARARHLAVIEIRDLAACLAQRYRIGDELEVTISERGRRERQGVGTLDDGTRIMVDDASDEIGRRLRVRVSSFSRTAGGFVVFARATGEGE